MIIVLDHCIRNDGLNYTKETLLLPGGSTVLTLRWSVHEQLVSNASTRPRRHASLGGIRSRRLLLSMFLRRETHICLI